MCQRSVCRFVYVASALTMLGILQTLLPSLSARADEATELLQASGVQGGLIVHLGCGDGELTAKLRVGDSYVVHGLTASGEEASGARVRMSKLGLGGSVSVETFIGQRLPYVDNLVNFLLVDEVGDVAPSELIRTLVPDGVVCLPATDAGVMAADLAKSGAIEISRTGDRLWFRKPRPQEIDQWTHCLHGSDNNPVADDLQVGPPKHLQWICGPKWSKHHEAYPPTIPVMVSAGGRVFYFEDGTPPSVFNVQARWSLVCRDAFNGVLLWRRPAPNWEPAAWPGDLGGGLSGGPVDYRRRLVAVGDRVYVTLGYRGPLMALDAATGETLQTYTGTGGEAVEVLHHEDALFISQTADRKSGYQILRLDAATGNKQWESTGGYGIAVDDGRVLFIANGQIGALDAQSGQLQWSASPVEGTDNASNGRAKGKSPRFNLQGPLRTGLGIVLVCPGGRGAIVALSVADGKRLWTFQNKGFRTFFRPVTAWIINGLVWVTDAGTPEGEVADDYLALGLDPQTGEVRQSVPCGAVWNCGHHQRCYPTKATTKYLIFSRRGAEFLNLADAQVDLNNWMRGTCGYGVMPANGLLYAPPHSCRCYSEAALRGLYALAPERVSDDAATTEQNQPRIERGVAYNDVAPGPSANLTDSISDWPTYRHDAARSGSTLAGVIADLQPQWETDLGGKISPPVVVAGTVYLAATDAHTLIALNADTGQRRWQYITGGRIDTPPTVHNGKLLVGSADGWVYCLRVEDGQLIWRYRAAPEDLRMGCSGQIESVWPVHGSILVQDDVAYFAAGRGSFVDGGIWVYGLDVATGDKRYEHHLQGPDTGAGFTRENPGRGFVMPGSLPDVLVSDGQQVYMRHLAFDPELKQATDMQPNFYEAPVRAGEEFGGDHKFWCDLLEAGPRAFVGKPQWDFRSYFNHFPGQRLYSTTGLLDDSWHIRSYRSYGQIVGQNLVFRGDRGYAVLAYPNAARWANYQAGDGYILYSGRTSLPQGDEPLYALKAEQRDWQTKLPLRPVAMVLAGDHLLVAGPPDAADPAEAAAGLEGRRGGLFRVISAADGTVVSELRLDKPPVYDGLIVADGKAFIATTAGRLICLQ